MTITVLFAGDGAHQARWNLRNIVSPLIRILMRAAKGAGLAAERVA